MQLISYLAMVLFCSGVMLWYSKKDKKLIAYLDKIKEEQQQHTITISNLKIYIDTHHEAHKNALHSLAERHHFLQKEVTQLRSEKNKS